MESEKLEEHLKETAEHFDYVIPRNKSLEYKLKMVSQFVLGYVGKHFTCTYSAENLVFHVPDETFGNISLVLPTTNSSEKNILVEKAKTHLNRSGETLEC